MWQLEARLTSKLLHYDACTHNAVIDDGSTLRGRIEKDAHLAWLASGSYFEVVCARSGRRIATHYFGGPDGDLTITAVQYLTWSKGRGFVVGLESKNNFGNSWGLLCLYHLGKSRVIRAVELPAQVKALEIVSNIGGANCNTHHLHQHLRWLFGVVALVTHRGWIYLLDLCLDIPLDQSDETNRAGIQLVRASVTNLPSLRQRAMAESLHICVELQAGAVQSIAGSALHYAPRTNQLAVGYENGIMQLWDMNSLQQVFQSNLPKAMVRAFALQEPENDPRKCCYLWTVQTRPGIDNEIILHMFQMEFKERTSSSSAKILYKGLNACKQRYTQIISAEMSAEQAGHTVCSLLGCHTVERYRHESSDTSLLGEESLPNTSVVIFVWETAKNHTSRPSITLGMFDINRWYHAQMPTHLSHKELNSYFAVWSLNLLLAEAPSQCILDTIVHEHSLTHAIPNIYPPQEPFFCPSSFSFDITCLLDEGIIHLNCPALQHEVLNSLSWAAPLSDDSLCMAYDRCATAGLLSPYFADISPSHLSWEEKMEAVLMAVLRSGHLSMFTKTVRAWAAVGNLDSVRKLCFLLQWTWNKVVLTKEEIDNLCMPLFDGSSRVADPLALSLLRKAHACLLNLKSILNLFLKEAPALIDTEDIGCKSNVIELLSHYILMVLWFCHAHLLPEIPGFLYCDNFIMAEGIQVKLGTSMYNEKLKPNDGHKRKAFALEMLSRIEDDEDYLKKIMLIDEACFHVQGTINRYNVRIWDSENPHVVIEHITDSPKGLKITFSDWPRELLDHRLDDRLPRLPTGRRTCSSTHWLTDFLVHPLADGLARPPTGSRTSSSTHWLTDLLVHPLADGLPRLPTGRGTCSSTHWLTDFLVHPLADGLARPPTGSRTSSSTHWPTDLLVHPLADGLPRLPTGRRTCSSTDWLTDFLVHPLADGLARPPTGRRTCSFTPD
uniref:protein ELYS-like n=1 Tax=Myxine glutinosa TaxID=7769 RepID=UPI00358F71AF